MKIQNRILVGLAALLAVVGWWFYSHNTVKARSIDLIAEFPKAEHRSNSVPLESAFEVGTTMINGETKKTILAKPFARIIYTVTVPPDAWLDTNYGMRPDSWDVPGDGAAFRIGIVEGRTYDEILNKFVNPNEGGRKWFSAHLDLSAYEGRKVLIVFNTDPGPKGGGDSQNDFAVWGEPHVYGRR